MDGLVTEIAAGLLGAAIVVILLGGKTNAIVFDGAFINDGFGRFMKVLTLASLLVTLVMSRDFLAAEKIDKFEFPILILLSTLGMLMLPLIKQGGRVRDNHSARRRLGDRSGQSLRIGWNGYGWHHFGARARESQGPSATLRRGLLDDMGGMGEPYERSQSEKDEARQQKGIVHRQEGRLLHDVGSELAHHHVWAEARRIRAYQRTVAPDRGKKTAFRRNDPPDRADEKGVRRYSTTPSKAMPKAPAAMRKSPASSAALFAWTPSGKLSLAQTACMTPVRHEET